MTREQIKPIEDALRQMQGGLSPAWVRARIVRRMPSSHHEPDDRWYVELSHPQGESEVVLACTRVQIVPVAGEREEVGPGVAAAVGH